MVFTGVRYLDSFTSISLLCGCENTDCTTVRNVPVAHTHTHRLFLGLFIRHGQIYAPGTSSAPNQEARGREAKTESAPRKNSLGPTIKLQGEPETERRFRTPPCFRRPGRGTREGKVGRLPKGGGGASHGGSDGNGCGGCLVGQVALGIARCMERSADCFAWRYS